MKKVGAVIVAAGSSSRMEGADKLNLPLFGGTVLSKTVARFLSHPRISEVVVAAHPDRIREQSGQLAALQGGNLRIVAGGKTRFLSVQNGVAALSEDIGYVAIHDAARPFVRDSLITRVIAAAERYGAAAPGNAVTDTVKTVNPAGFTEKTLERGALRAMATPQVFSLPLYKAAAAAAPFDTAFDDCEVTERYGRPVFVVEGDADNMKITTKEDIGRMEALAGGEIRVGYGYDVHRFLAGRKLILGGVEIPFDAGLLGHSDADVLIHAVMDALLGAAALGDIGEMFPDSDPRYLGADSAELLRQVKQRLEEHGYSVVNVDITVVCQQPKLAPYRDDMRRAVAAALELDTGKISVKATTEEGLGFTGEMKGIAAHAVAAVKQR